MLDAEVQRNHVEWVIVLPLIQSGTIAAMLHGNTPPWSPEAPAAARGVTR
jgi:hypothetical protein